MSSLLSTVLSLVFSVLVGTAGTGDPGAAGGAPMQGKVVEVTDGDTVVVQSNGEKYDIRLVGVDTPEVYSSVNPQEFDATNESCVDRFADKASSFAKKKLLGEEVQILYDDKAGTKGSYDRYLGEIYTGMNGKRPVLSKNKERNFNLELLEQGYARVYEDSEYEDERHSLLHQAQSWAKGAPENTVWGCN